MQIARAGFPSAIVTVGKAVTGLAEISGEMFKKQARSVWAEQAAASGRIQLNAAELLDDSRRPCSFALDGPSALS